jgi:predicted nucleic acid-binding protein
LIEIEKYRDYLMKKAHQNEREFDLTLSALIERISFIPESDFINNMDRAEKIMEEIDPKDSPFLAVALTSKVDGIWSEDRDFDEQNVIRRYSTKDMIDLLLEK